MGVRVKEIYLTSLRDTVRGPVGTFRRICNEHVFYPCHGFLKGGPHPMGESVMKLPGCGAIDRHQVVETAGITDDAMVVKGVGVRFEECEGGSVTKRIPLDLRDAPFCLGRGCVVYRPSPISTRA